MCNIGVLLIGKSEEFLMIFIPPLKLKHECNNGTAVQHVIFANYYPLLF